MLSQVLSQAQYVINRARHILEVIQDKFNIDLVLLLFTMKSALVVHSMAFLTGEILLRSIVKFDKLRQIFHIT